VALATHSTGTEASHRDHPEMDNFVDFEKLISIMAKLREKSNAEASKA
jgi:hypothetical protein